jgi:phospholipase B1, membrane-associated
LNGAISRARIEHIQPQVTYLVQQGKVEPGVDFEKDWKILNIIIGGNNLFKCGLEESHPDQFEMRMNETLARIHREIPRVFVNLFFLFEKGLVDTYNNGKEGLYCSTLFRFLAIGFPCLVTTDELRQKMVEYAKEYNRRMEKLTKWWNANRQRKDFFIGLQPIFQHARVPDSSFSSQYDCFHPSAKANAQISMNAWNSMQLPWDKKPREAVHEFICPNENTFLQ